MEHQGRADRRSLSRYRGFGLLCWPASVAESGYRRRLDLTFDSFRTIPASADIAHRRVSIYWLSEALPAAFMLCRRSNMPAKQRFTHATYFVLDRNLSRVASDCESLVDCKVPPMKGSAMKIAFMAFILCMSVAASAAAPATAILDIQNMTCPLCPVTIRKALERTPGVIEAHVDYIHKTATVKYDPEIATPPTLVKATTQAGFPSKIHAGAKKMTSGVQKLISTLTCPECEHKTVEDMPLKSCRFFHECAQCHAVLRPKAGDCCVFCSYGSVKCPPIQSQYAAHSE